MKTHTLIFTGLAASVACMPTAALAGGGGGDALSGFRIEAIAGVDDLELEGDIDGVIVDDSDSSFLYGVGIGYDFRLGGLVLGVEAEYAQSEGSFDLGTFDVDDVGFESIGTDGEAYIGVRLGAAITPRTLLYAKAGAVATEVEIESFIPGQGLLGEFDDEGYRLGAGIEHALTDRFFAKAEYRYTDYGTAFTVVEDGDLFSEFENGLSTNQFVVGLGLRF